MLSSMRKKTILFSDMTGDDGSSKGKQKKYFCIYCKRLVLNFARHLQINHATEFEVAQLSALPKGSDKRMKILNEIRGRGTLYFNTSPELNKGTMIVKRRVSQGLAGYSPCPKCKNFYKKSSLYKHFKLCTGLGKTPKNLQTTSLSFSLTSKTGYMDPWLKSEIVPGLSNKSNLRTTIIEDTLLVEYGNYLCIRHRTNQHLSNMVRGKLRQMAKLLIAMRDIDQEITTLESALKPAKYDVFMKAVDMVAGFDSSKTTYRAPSLVNHLGNSAQECANILQTRAIKIEDEDLQAKVVNWLKLYKQGFYYGVGKSALNKLAEKKWNKPRLVPVAKDIMKLNNFINKTIEEANKSLDKGFDKKAFDDLNKATMLQVIVFNRKRIGEVEKLLISDFKKRHNIQQESEIYKTMTIRDKIVATRYMRMEVRGKLGRPVSLLISTKQVDLINKILNLRGKANVSTENPYVFGKYGILNKNFYSASPALRWYSQNCGASRPDLLTGTKLRKHMATISQAMDLTENDLSILADFMGHNITTHRNFYRMPSEVTHLARISQVLLSLEEGDVTRYAGKRLEDINVDVVVDEPDEEDEQPLQDSSPSTRTNTEDRLEDIDDPSPVVRQEKSPRKVTPPRQTPTPDSPYNATATEKRLKKIGLAPSHPKTDKRPTSSEDLATPPKKKKATKKLGKHQKDTLRAESFPRILKQGGYQA